MDRRTETASIESNSEPDAILRILDDARRIPEWAPAFADAVEGDPHSGWRVRKDDRAFSLRVSRSIESRTVDYLRELAPGREGGAYLRVLPRPGGGSVVVMTLPVPPGGDSERLAETLRRELAALVRLAERPPGA